MNTTPKESEEQFLFCEYLRVNGYRYTSTQNGAVLGGNRFAQMAKFKKTGLAAGFPDLIVFAKNQSKTADVLFVEMKRKKGSVLSPHQKEWIKWLDDNGYNVAIAKGHEQAIEFFNKYLRS